MSDSYDIHDPVSGVSPERRGKVGPHPLPLGVRFFRFVEPRPTGCWEWTGSKNQGGYGLFCTARARSIAAHKWCFQLLIGDVPAGLELDHLCRNRWCVNPTHLEPVTRRENILRGENFCAKHAKQTHCKNGHPLSGPNLRIRSYDGGRLCRTCQHGYSVAQQAKRKASAA